MEREDDLTAAQPVPASHNVNQSDSGGNGGVAGSLPLEECGAPSIRMRWHAYNVCMYSVQSMHIHYVYRYSGALSVTGVLVSNKKSDHVPVSIGSIFLELAGPSSFEA